MPTLNTSTSIIDFLKSQGKDSSFSARAALAQQAGIQGYQGTADQNTQLLRTLSGGGSLSGTLPPPTPIGQSTTLPNGTTPAPVGGATLPQAKPQSSLVAFSQVLDKVTELAGKKRRAAEMEFLGNKIPLESGLINASSFGDILNTLETRRAASVEPMTKSAIEAFKFDQEQQQADKASIREIALNVATLGGTSEIVEAVLAAGDLDSAIRIASGSLAKKNKGELFTKGNGAVVLIDEEGNVLKEVLPAGSAHVPGSGGSGGASTGGGGTASPRKLTATAQAEVDTLDVVAQLAQQLLQIGKQEEGYPGAAGLGGGTVGAFLSKNIGFGGGGEKGQQVRDLIGNIKATIAKMRGGTSFTPNEEALLSTYTPTINDSDVVLEQKLEDLIAFINQKKNITLGYGAAPDLETLALQQDFDLEAARKAGYTDEEIINILQ